MDLVHYAELSITNHSVLAQEVTLGLQPYNVYHVSNNLSKKTYYCIILMFILKHNFISFLASEETTVGCKSNSECPLSQACINGACANPCACGNNAECSVIRHHPVCYCERGFSGNPYIGCTKGMQFNSYVKIGCFTLHK